ncbi:MAG: hypothetical protein ACE5Q6_22700 [Dehalococcoidia bacterium]
MAEQKVDVQAVARAGLLRRAQRWVEEEQPRRATAAYWELIDYHPETDEAEKAVEMLLGQADKYEEQGQTYQALTIYNRLANSSGVRHRVLPKHV